MTTHVDPTEALKRIRLYIEYLSTAGVEGIRASHVYAFADDVRAIDETLSRGGHFPRQWELGSEELPSPVYLPTHWTEGVI